MRTRMTVHICDLPRCGKRRIAELLPPRWVEYDSKHYCCEAHRDEDNIPSKSGSSRMREA